MAQISRFPDGGMVAHKVRVPGSARLFSAWYDSAGRMLDCEARAGLRYGAVGAQQRAYLARAWQWLSVTTAPTEKGV